MIVTFFVILITFLILFGVYYRHRQKVLDAIDSIPEDTTPELKQDKDDPTLWDYYMEGPMVLKNPGTHTFRTSQKEWEEFSKKLLEFNKDPKNL